MAEHNFRREPYEVKYGSTRPIVLRNGEVHAFTPEALHGWARQMNNGAFLPIHIEHLTYLPPSARLVAGRLEPAHDGALDLIATIEEVPSLVIGHDDSHPLPPAPRSVPVVGQAPPLFHVLVEPGNFAPGKLAELVNTAPVPVKRRSQWAELPPLELLFVFSVAPSLAIGLASFWKSFTGELGTQAGKALAD